MAARRRSGEAKAANGEDTGDGEATNVLPTTSRTCLHYRMTELGFHTRLATAMVARRRDAMHGSKLDKPVSESPSYGPE
jgi:hypothetical protein